MEGGDKSKQMEERLSYWPLDANPAVGQVMLLSGRENKAFSGKGERLVQSLPIWFVLSPPLETEPSYLAGKLSTAKLS